MSLADQASLLLIPSGYKESKIYSVFPTTGVGDFTFNRNSSATRIAKNGLITSVATDIPRLEYPLIDGVVNGCPSLLLENSATNLIPYSESLNNWIQERITTTVNSIISPQGNMSADKINIDSTANSTHQAYVGALTNTVGNVCISGFFKKGEYEWVHIGSGIANSKAFFNLKNGTVGEKLQDVVSSNIIDYGNGWYRCISVVNSSTTSNYWEFGMAVEDGNTIISGTPESGGLYAWGIQVENDSSYPTSYIPTNGTAVTRLAETANGAGDASTFNDSEGVLMAEISALADDLTFRNITISDGSNSNAIYLRYRSTSNVLQALLVVGGVGETYGVNLNDITTFSKAAIKYKENDVAFWVNGFEMVVDTSASTFPNNTLNTLNFQRGNDTLPFYGKTKQLQYFQTALTDSELEQLTSWISFTDLATSQLYSIK